MATPYNPIIEGETESDRRQRSREMMDSLKKKQKEDKRFNWLTGALGLKGRDKTEQYYENLGAVSREAKAKALRGG